MIVAERVNQYITELHPEAICDGCIASALDLRPQQVNQVTTALGTTGEFDRRPGICFECAGGWGAELITRRRRAMSAKRVCPECGKKFKGRGWEGIYAHWRARHEEIMHYEDAWPLIRDGKYTPQISN